MNTFKTLTATATAFALATTMALASGVALTQANKDSITQILTEQGYTVGKIKLEDGLYEAYAKKDGKKLEVFLDEAFQIVKIKE